MPDHTVVLSVTGEVAYQSPGQIPGAVRAAIVRWAPVEILIDLGDVSVLDRPGIVALLESLRTAGWAGIPIVLINVGAYLMGQFRESGLADLVRAQAPVEPADPPAV